jgi:hypothetical protein
MIAINISPQKNGEEKYPESCANISNAMIVKPIVRRMYTEMGVLVFIVINLNYSALAV